MDTGPVRRGAVIPALAGCKLEGSVDAFTVPGEDVVCAANCFGPLGEIWICEVRAEAEGVGEEVAIRSALKNFVICCVWTHTEV